MQLLAISGSLRATSSNTTLLKAATTLDPENVEIRVYQGLGDLPHFNPDLDGPDLDGEEALSPVRDFRAQLKVADGVLISSPEYAHGVPGVLKNALDWIVSSGEFIGKPVALLNASPHASHAQASLTETLTVMMANIIPEASLTVPLPSNKVSEADIIANPAIVKVLHAAILAFVHTIDAGQAEAESH